LSIYLSTIFAGVAKYIETGIAKIFYEPTLVKINYINSSLHRNYSFVSDISLCSLRPLWLNHSDATGNDIIYTFSRTIFCAKNKFRSAIAPKNKASKKM
jgi:hypothetical protein